MIERMDDILNHLEEYELEGDRRYIYHPEGCTVAPTVNLEEATEIMYQIKTRLDDVRNWIADPFADVTLTDREREVIGLASRGVSAVGVANRTGTQRQAVYEAIWRAISKIEKARDVELDLDTLVAYAFSQLERIVS